MAREAVHVPVLQATPRRGIRREVEWRRGGPPILRLTAARPSLPARYVRAFFWPASGRAKMPGRPLACGVYIVCKPSFLATKSTFGRFRVEFVDIVVCANGDKRISSLSLYRPLHTGISLRARDTTMSTSTRQPRPSGAPRFRRACRLRHPRGGHRAAADRALPAGPLARHAPARARTRPVRPCRRWMVAPGCDRRLWGVGSARATCRPRLLADQRAPMRPRPRCRPDAAQSTPRPMGWPHRRGVRPSGALRRGGLCA